MCVDDRAALAGSLMSFSASSAFSSTSCETGEPNLKPSALDEEGTGEEEEEREEVEG
jgi:hypothetical protein